MRKIILPSILLIFILYSCFASDNYVPAMISFKPPENAGLNVRDIRARGFTLEWTEPHENKYEYEYAIAVSHNGNIENYETALEHDNIVLDFTPDYMLNGVYKVAGLIAGQEYAIKLFVRSRNIEITEFISAKTSRLPYLDDAEILSVRINGHEAVYDRRTDSYSHYYFAGMEDGEYAFTYRLLRGCVLYINGKQTDDEVIRLTPGEPLEVTAVHERSGAARDYIISVNGRSNGIPLVIIDTESPVRDKVTNIPGQMKIIDSEHNPLGVGLYDGYIEMRGRGSSSWGMPKQGYNLFLPNNTQIFDMAPGKSWALIANYADKSLMRNYLAYEFARDLGMAMSPKMRHIDLILNGEFMGNYIIGERIKVDRGRLDFPKITADITDSYDLTGTYVLEINDLGRVNNSRVRAGEIRIFNSPHVNPRIQTVWGHPSGTVVVIRQPAARNLPEAGFEYIRDYFNAADDALFGDNFKDAEKGYRAYLDVPSWIDWYLVNELVKNVDGDFRLSTFIYKPRGGKLHMGPVWDFDLTMGNADYLTGDNPEGWYVRLSVWHRRLFECEAFAQEFKDRWNYIKNNGYFDVFFRRIDDTAEMLGRSAEMNFAKWPILGRYVWPNAGNVSQRTTYQSEIDYLKDWMRRRIEWMDNEINS